MIAEVRSGLAILLVDDEPFANKLHEQMLVELGHTVLGSVTNGGQALAVLDSNADAIDVIVLDLNMPEMDGIQFLREISQRQFSGALIFVSGAEQKLLETVSSLAEQYSVKVLGLAQKPVSSENLGALLELARSGGPVDTRDTSSSYAFSAERLLEGVTRGELCNFYQPKVDIHTKAFRSVEALSRWRHPSSGLIFPNDFIPVAETHGFISAVTHEVIKQSLQQLGEWQARGLTLNCAVNVSVDDLTRLEFPDTIDQLVLAAGMTADRLTLEITESRLVSDLLTATDVLARLSIKGYKLSIDDFGQGYSSLAQLRDFPFDQLKIDRGFVTGAHADKTLEAIYTASLDIAQRLGMEAIAEGVETAADWDFVFRTGCDTAQGYLIAMPLEAHEVEGWAKQWAQISTPAA